MATVCVELAVRDDVRAVETLRSLAGQTRRPDRVLVAASTDTPPSLAAALTAAAPGLPVDIAQFPGGVVDARAGSLPLLHEDIVAFLDSDERAPPEWLGRLVAPIEEGRAGFTGGPTRPVRPAETTIERYYELLERSIYSDLVPRSIRYVPLQNSAWSAALLRRLGFDPRIPFAEDHDLEVRALREGASGVFVPDAFVFHDKSSETSLWRWARKRYRYLVAMGMSLLKNGELEERLRERRRPVPHPLRYVEAAMKPFALVEATIRWRRIRSRSET